MARLTYSVNSDLYLFLKQLRMWTKAIKHQNKNISTNLINKKPVRFDVTLTRTFVVSCKVMIPVFCIQRTAIRQNIDYLKQLIKIFILLFCKLQILFKLIGKLNVVISYVESCLKRIHTGITRSRRILHHFSAFLNGSGCSIIWYFQF